MRRCMGCMREFNDAYELCPHCGYVCGTPARSKNHLPPGTLLLNRYILGKVLGQGGFGITYIAWDQRLEKAVAIKEFFPTSLASRMTGQNDISCFNADSQQYFESGLQKMMTESRLMARFSDQPNIVQVLDCVEANGTAYIIMELLRGETVQNILSREEKLPLERTMQIILPVLQALDAIHRTGLIHRDVSPDNIFLCEDGRAKLLDFGAARIASGMDHKTLSVMLKKGYAPTEQYSSHGIQGAYTDVYAVCATMYKMLTGATPVSSLDRMASDTLRPISAYVPIPQSIESIILQGMAIDAPDRIQTAAELFSRLQNALRAQLRNTNMLEDEPSKDKKKGVRHLAEQTPPGQDPGRKVVIAIVVLAMAAVAVVGVILGVLYFGGKDDGETTEPEPTQVQAVAQTTAHATQPQSPFAGLVVGDTAAFGRYEQNGIESDGPEEIIWFVADVSDEGKMLLVSRYAIDCMPYQPKKEDVVWKNCSVRKWLNGTFYDGSFSDEEKAWIQETALANPDNSEYKTSGGGETRDRIFLLSLDEAKKLDSANLLAQPTTYAARKGAFRNDETGNTWWMLRSPGSGSQLCAIVRSDGGVRAGGELVNSQGAVRPAMWVNIA